MSKITINAFKFLFTGNSLRNNFDKIAGLQHRFCSTVIIEESRTIDSSDGQKSGIPADVRHLYPEFLPTPAIIYRHPVKEKLERQDMLRRRRCVNIPEFYVGSILAVTSSNIHAPNKTSRFVGICIQRTGTGLFSKFLLRNVIDNMGIDMVYSLYDPTIQKIDVLRLEKRLDDCLLYLRDAYPEYSTIPFDMEPEYLPAGTEVPINPIKVKLKPRPWRARYERGGFKGLQDLGLPERFYKRAAALATPYEKYDLMKQYRATIPAEEQEQIYAEVYSELKTLEITKKKLKRRREFIPPKKTA